MVNALLTHLIRPLQSVIKTALAIDAIAVPCKCNSCWSIAINRAVLIRLARFSNNRTVFASKALGFKAYRFNVPNILSCIHRGTETKDCNPYPLAFSRYWIKAGSCMSLVCVYPLRIARIAGHRHSEVLSQSVDVRQSLLSVRD